MTWVRLDDSMPEHPKMEALSDRAFRLHVSALCYCNRLLTDGEIPASTAHRMVGNGKRYAAELVAAGIWDAVDDGFKIHDYEDYQPSRETVLRERAKTAERVSRWRARNAVTNTVSNGHVTPSPVPDPVPAQNSPKEGQSIASLVRLSDHQINDQNLSPAVRDSIERLMEALGDADKGTAGRLVRLAHRGASQAHFEDARVALADVSAKSPSRYACRIIENRLKPAPKESA